MTRAEGGALPVAWAGFNKHGTRVSMGDKDVVTRDVSAEEEFYPQHAPYTVVPLYATPQSSLHGMVRFDPPVRLDAPDGGIVRGHVSVLPPPVAPSCSASFDAALAALDYQPVDVRDNGTHVYELLGLDDVRAAHAEEVAQAVVDERDACARIVRAFLEQHEPGDDARLTLEQAEQDIRARKEPKS